VSFAKTKSDAVAKLDGTFREEEVEARKRQKIEAKQRSLAAAAGAAAPAAAAAGPAAPSTNRLLFAENLPPQANEAMLSLVFQQFPGFKEVRMVAQRPGIAFVEYDNEAGAAAALAGLQGFRLATDKPMQLAYAKA
jgi:U2 small nuclear ribonucleoprotein B''